MNLIRLAAEGRFTSREQDIIRLAAEGLSNWEIAEKLGLALGTVKYYLTRIFLKTGLKRREQLIIGYHQSRLSIVGPKARAAKGAA